MNGEQAYDRGIGWLLLLVVPLGFAAFAILFLWAMTGEWPELVLPGSRAGAHEAEWYRPERKPRFRRLRRLARYAHLPRGLEASSRSPSSSMRAEITWRVWRTAPRTRCDAHVPTHLDLLTAA